MTPDEFITQRRSAWQELETLLNRARGSLQSFENSDVDRLGRLYRTATADLAMAQRDFPRHQATIYLNQLVGRAHAVVYREQPLRWRRLVRFYTHDFPALYRAVLPWTIASFALIAIPLLAAFFLVWQYPNLVYMMLGDDLGTRQLVSEVQRGQLWTDIAPSARSAASSMILTNNIQVMFLTFAGGMTAGILTALVLISNGYNLGGTFGLLQAYDVSWGLLDFVVAHGFVELSIIFLAGGCGLYLGDGIVRPGLRGRGDVLIERGRTGAILMLGSAPLLVGAGVIEGFISPSGLPFWLKLGVGLLTGGALHWYWLRAGRQKAAPLPAAQPASATITQGRQEQLPEHG